MSSSLPSDSLSPIEGVADNGKRNQGDSGGKIVHRRSKVGCLVCRARRVKCDLGQPECAKCVKYGAECGYPSKKPLDLEAISQSLQKRHKSSDPHYIPPTPSSDSPYTAHGQFSIPSVGMSDAGPSTGPSSVERQSSGPKLYDDGSSSLDAVHALCRMTTMGSFFSDPIGPPDMLKNLFSDPDDRKCFHHCLTYTFSTLVIKEDQNPWLAYITPLLFVGDPKAPLSKKALGLSMLAIGATHLAYLHNRVDVGGDPHIRDLSVRYRSETMQILRKARRVQDEIMSNTFLAASLLLNHNDCLASERTWKEAWRCTKDAVHARGGCEAMLWEKPSIGRRAAVVEKMLLEQMAFIDLAASLSIGEPPSLLNPSLGWWQRLETEVLRYPDEPDSVEDTKGLRRDIIYLAARAIKLAADRRTMENHRLVSERRQGSTPHVVTDHVAMSPFGLSLQTVVLAHNDDVATLANDVDRWVDERYSNKVVSDHRVRLGSMALWHMIQLIVKLELQNVPKSDESAQSHSKAILDLCLEAGDKIEHLNWPLIVASWTLSDLKLRERSREIIRLFAYQCCNELSTIREVIEEVWKRMDEGVDAASCHYLEVMMDTGRAVLLA